MTHNLVWFSSQPADREAHRAGPAALPDPGLARSSGLADYHPVLTSPVPDDLHCKLQLAPDALAPQTVVGIRGLSVEPAAGRLTAPDELRCNVYVCVFGMLGLIALRSFPSEGHELPVPCWA